MPPQILRDYQADGKRRILEAIEAGARSVLAVAPTAAGKTTIFGDMCNDWASQGIPSLVNVHRRELATQASNRLREFGVRHGLIMPGEPRILAPVQVAMVQTLSRRIGNFKPPAKRIVNDEAHLSTATTWRKILDEYPEAKVIGFTASPWRLGGRPLSSDYDAVVVIATPAELRKRGSLCDYDGFSYKHPDLSGVDVMSTGDYNDRQSAEAMMKPVIVDSVVEEWLKHASTLSTVVFAVTVKHSLQLCEKFKAAGIRAEHLDGKTPVEQRRAILRRVDQGITQVLCNVGVAVEGLDIPRLKCCVLARPTKSLARAIQMMGRVRRPWNGVTARIHDHAFVISQHGLPDDDRDYSLNAKATKPATETSDLAQCKKCFAFYRSASCQACSEPRPVAERKIAMLTDAEQWAFSSGTVGVAPQEPKERPTKPTTVRWETPGRVVEGKLVKRWDEPASYGKQRFYLVSSVERDYVLPGTTVLNSKLSIVANGANVRVEYKGEAPGQTRKEFAVGVDAGQDLPLSVRAGEIYASGKSTTDVARVLGVSPAQGWKLVKESGVPMRSRSEGNAAFAAKNPDVVARASEGRRYSKERADALVALYMSGASLARTCKEQKCSLDSLRDLLILRGINIRTSEEQWKLDNPGMPYGSNA
jgi:DNA repair protein RadD